MKHLIICREYPPVPGGGIGSYSLHMARLLAAAGDTVHVLSQTWRGARRPVDVSLDDRLIVHRVPFERPGLLRKRVLRSGGRGPGMLELFDSAYFPAAFSLAIASVVEGLVERHEIDVIEAPEYEGCLSHFFRRRRGGLGPSRRPPCLIHLHSPTEDIWRQNGWGVANDFVRQASALEGQSIHSADHLLAPSAYLARSIERRYDLAPNSISVIPYPLGEVPALDRPEEVWIRGSVLFFGRLEGRKGIFEWIDAALQVLQDFPQTRFEFLGENVLDENWLGGRQNVRGLVPKAVRKNFHFHGLVARSGVYKILRNARIVAVPSRWDNYPNTCMEAMASGAPVVATREGGMAEMIASAETGWLSVGTDADSLAEVLRKALIAPPETLAQMGKRASVALRSMCDSGSVVERHRELRREIISHGASNSLTSRERPAPRPDESDCSPNPTQASEIGLARKFARHPLAVSEYVVHAFNRRIGRFMTGF